LVIGTPPGPAAEPPGGPYEQRSWSYDAGGDERAAQWGEHAALDEHAHWDEHEHADWDEHEHADWDAHEHADWEERPDAEAWPEEPAVADPGPGDDELAQTIAQQRGVEPEHARVLHDDPRTLRLVPAIRYILAIPSNWLMIVGSSLGYFFFAGLSTFALIFVRGQYHVGQAASELGLALLVGGALIGTLASGAATDALLRRGFLEARVWVPAGCYVGAAIVLIPGILGHRMYPAVWFDAAGAALISAANPPLNAARLDIMPAGLWGRAESTRTFIRSILQALAPLLFGGVADLIAGFVPRQAPIGTHPGLVSASTATGLKWTFLIMLGSLAAGGVFLARASASYPRDVATAGASHPGSVD
jgi:hypothetical protein